MDASWSHNSAYHPWILKVAAAHHGVVLDVGCGDGLLVQRLAPVSSSVLGIDPDEQAVARATARLRAVGNATLRTVGFEDLSPAATGFDVIVFGASIHHMALRPALAKARTLLAPAGDLLVVGVAANGTPLDWLVAAVSLPPVRVMGLVRHERRDPAVRVAAPDKSLPQIRRIAREELPGVSIRRGLYYRYLLRWTSPS